MTWFRINQTYIATYLCENKDKPELVCCGKCVLTKELKKVDGLEEQGKKTNSIVELSTQVLFVVPEPFSMPTDIFLSFLKPQYPLYSTMVLPSFSQSIFRPPIG